MEQSEQSIPHNIMDYAFTGISADEEEDYGADYIDEDGNHEDLHWKKDELEAFKEIAFLPETPLTTKLQQIEDNIYIVPKSNKEDIIQRYGRVLLEQIDVLLQENVGYIIKDLLWYFRIRILETPKEYMTMVLLKEIEGMMYDIVKEIINV